MLKEYEDQTIHNSIFSNMHSILNPTSGIWPLNLALPSPVLESEVQKLPNIFPEETKKKCKTVTACPHSARKHYAKNMFNNCYHRNGRHKIAWACQHLDRKHYAKGKCQFCYLKTYNQTRQDVLITVDNI